MNELPTLLPISRDESKKARLFGTLNRQAVFSEKQLNGPSVCAEKNIDFDETSEVVDLEEWDGRGVWLALLKIAFTSHSSQLASKRKQKNNNFGQTVYHGVNSLSNEDDTRFDNGRRQMNHLQQVAWTVRALEIRPGALVGVGSTLSMIHSNFMFSSATTRP